MYRTVCKLVKKNVCCSCKDNFQDPCPVMRVGVLTCVVVGATTCCVCYVSAASSSFYIFMFQSTKMCIICSLVTIQDCGVFPGQRGNVLVHKRPLFDVTCV